MNLWQAAAIIYGGMTAGCAGAQAIENTISGKAGRYWAPVWWIALTWPFWMIVGPRKHLSNENYRRIMSGLAEVEAMTRADQIPITKPDAS